MNSTWFSLLLHANYTMANNSLYPLILIWKFSLVFRIAPPQSCYGMVILKHLTSRAALINVSIQSISISISIIPTAYTSACIVGIRWSHYTFYINKCIMYKHIFKITRPVITFDRPLEIKSLPLCSKHNWFTTWP